MRRKIYLAGPIEGLSYDGATGWRDDLKLFLNDFGVDGYSPMRAKQYLEDEAAIGAAGDYDTVLSTPQAITCRDAWDCRTSDMVLVNYEGVHTFSIGTVMEIGMAYAWGVPVVIAAPPDSPIRNHPMVKIMAPFHVETAREAARVCLDILLP